MAEGWVRALKASAIEAYSAGARPNGLNPLAVRAMAELGVGLSRHTSEWPENLGVDHGVLATVRDWAHECCSVIPGIRVVHHRLDEPPRLARGAATNEDAMVQDRRVRDETRALTEMPPGLAQAPDRSDAGRDWLKGAMRCRMNPNPRATSPGAAA